MDPDIVTLSLALAASSSASVSLMQTSEAPYTSLSRLKQPHCTNIPTTSQGRLWICMTLYDWLLLVKRMLPAKCDHTSIIHHTSSGRVHMAPGSRLHIMTAPGPSDRLRQSSFGWGHLLLEPHTWCRSFQRQLCHSRIRWPISETKPGV